MIKSYNAGATEDLEEVISYILKENFQQLALTGFSLGGNLMLKYLGERTEFPPELKAAVAVSTPCNLHKSLLELDKPQNWIYSKRFVAKLKQQLYLRESRYPANISKSDIDSCNNLFSIDDLYTGKAHGFKDALDYYEKNSALQFIPHIKIPTLLINAKNDGFLSKDSSPVELARVNPWFHLEMPDHGGHVAFLQNKNETYAEERALEFIEKQLQK
ncbi:alpha/beta fold hydrolase [Antarcticibacterium sp. 1MA-6-2]|uniref:YheT family hydrolase n=1 Tax=Antarcticibacterium sp. 1MA-6-2 TaxID=2908210 RepID=UPI002882DE31|nr:alpha/beta fold hydrolase [Antarcticibacterium sp. 1MA-6-2]